MGFWDFEVFNLALLGKHGWRFMVSPESLCFRVMKSRYFPETDLCMPPCYIQPSPIWRAIIAWREALQAGLRMRVGDGRNISVWQDKWTPLTHSMRPMYRLAHWPIHTVNALINEDNWTWRTELVRDTFLPLDADAILNNPRWVMISLLGLLKTRKFTLLNRRTVL